MVTMNLFFLTLRRTPRSTLFPYTTLFRSYLQGLFRTLYFIPSITPGVVVALIFYQIFGVWGSLLDKQSAALRSEEHTSELQSQSNLVCRLLLEKKKCSNSLDAA